MEKTKNGSRAKKILKIVVAVVLVLTLAQLLVLGILGGIGPFGFIRENKIKNHPGNKPEYDFSQLTAMENSPLAGGKLQYWVLLWHRAQPLRATRWASIWRRASIAP